MGGVISRENRYDADSSFDEGDPDNAVGTLSRRSSRTRSIGNILEGDVAAITANKIAVPCACIHPFADYRMGRKLGAGAYSTVVKAVSAHNENLIVAIKEVRKLELSRNQLEDLELEMTILSQVCHPNIVKLYAVYNIPEKLFMVTEYLKGGELLKAISKRKHYEERDAKRIMLQITSAVHHIHSRRVIHRDLKPENIILQTRDFFSDIKIVDFGFAMVLDGGASRSSKYAKGTPGYMPPEVLSHASYSLSVDIWSLGVIMYIVLSGTLPFDPKNKQMILKADFSFLDEVWAPVSDSAKDLIKKMLVVEPEKRVTAAQALLHPWLASYTAERAAEKLLQFALEKEKEQEAEAAQEPPPSLTDANATRAPSPDQRSSSPSTAVISFEPSASPTANGIRHRSNSLLHTIAEQGESDTSPRSTVRRFIPLVDVDDKDAAGGKLTGEVEQAVDLPAEQTTGQMSALPPQQQQQQKPASRHSSASSIPQPEPEPGNLSMSLENIRHLIAKVRTMGRVVQSSIRFRNAGIERQKRRRSSPGMAGVPIKELALADYGGMVEGDEDSGGALSGERKHSVQPVSGHRHSIANITMSADLTPSFNEGCPPSSASALTADDIKQNPDESSKSTADGKEEAAPPEDRARDSFIHESPAGIAGAWSEYED